MKIPNRKVVICIIWVWAIIVMPIFAYKLGVELGKHFSSLKTCRWCGDAIWEEGTDIGGGIWLHNICWSNLAVEYDWNTECTWGKMQEIKKAIRGNE